MISFAVLARRFSLFILFGIIVVSLFSDSWEMSLFLAQSFLLSSILSFLAMILDNRRGGISYMFEFFMLFFIAVPATVQVTMQIFPWFAVLQPVYICWTFGILALSHMAYQIGLSFQEYVYRKQSISTPSLELSIKDALFYTKWAWSLAILAILFAIAAGPSNLFVARFERGEQPFEGLTQQFLFMCRSLSLLAMVILIFLVKFTRHSRLRFHNIYAVLLFLMPFLAINYLPALSRFVLFGIFLALSTFFVDYFRPKVKAFVALASVAVLFIIFPVIKSLGTGELNTSGVMQRADFSMIFKYLLRVDFDVFMQIASTIEYYIKEMGPIRYGANFIGVVLFFVPRALWPDKPVNTGELVATGLGFPYTNVSSPLAAEALMGFGVIGPAIVFFLLAFYIAKIEVHAKWHQNAMPEAASFFIYAIFMGFIVIILRGALNSVAPQFATAFLAFFVMQFAKKYKFELL